MKPGRTRRSKTGKHSIAFVPAVNTTLTYSPTMKVASRVDAAGFDVTSESLLAVRAAASIWTAYLIVRPRQS